MESYSYLSFSEFHLACFQGSYWFNNQNFIPFYGRVILHLNGETIICLLIQSSTGGHVGWPHLLAILNKAAMNINIQVPFQVLIGLAKKFIWDFP